MSNIMFDELYRQCSAGTTRHFLSLLASMNVYLVFMVPSLHVFLNYFSLSNSCFICFVNSKVISNYLSFKFEIKHCSEYSLFACILGVVYKVLGLPNDFPFYVPSHDAAYLFTVIMNADV